MKVYIVGGKPHPDEPDVGLWKTWRFQPIPARRPGDSGTCSPANAWPPAASTSSSSRCPSRPPARARPASSGSSSPTAPARWTPISSNFLDEARRELASDLLRHNDRADLLEGTRLNEAVQRILDRILFLRICEDRDIDTGRPLARISRPGATTRTTPARRARQPSCSMREEPPAHYGGSGLRAPKGSLWRAVVRHFRALDRRPPSHVPFFNGNLFKPHFSEELVVSDEWLAGFLDDLSDEESPYLFNVIPVEILGTHLRAFPRQGRPPAGPRRHHRGKARGPQSRRRLLHPALHRGLHRRADRRQAPGRPDARRPACKLRILDPACGSGSFLIRAFERVCEHWQHWFTDAPGTTRRRQDCAGPTPRPATST